MASHRSLLMIVMAQEGQTANSLDLKKLTKYDAMIIPNYESIKGNTLFERELAVRGWQHLKELENIRTENDKTIMGIRKFTKDEENYDSVSEDKTSGSEYIPSLSCDSDNNGEIDKKSNINIWKLKRKVQKNYNTPSTQRKPKLRPSTSIYSHKEIHLKNIDYVQDNAISTSSEIDFAKPKSKNKIKIISDVQIKPSYSEFSEFDKPDSTTEFISKRPADNLVKIAAAKKDSEGKRVRDKKHLCYFCHELILHMARHLEVKHSDEMDVARALAFPKNSCKRKKLFSEITRAGDFHYNCEVLSIKRGELILVRRPTMNEFLINKYNNYGPCPNCLEFLLKKNLWHHIKANCREKDRNNQEDVNPEFASRQIIAESNAILSSVFGTEFSTDYKKYIINNLRGDDVGDCCKEDNLILKFGAMQFEKYVLTHCELIRQNMRPLARLTMSVKEITSLNLKLFDLLTPQRFDIVVQGVKQLCGRHQNDSTKRPEFNIPSLALKLGHSFKKCANIERGLALRHENLRRNEALLAFCNLMELEWQIRISSNALSTLYKKKLNVGQLLPLTSDAMNILKQE